MTRNLYSLLNSKVAWCQRLFISKEATLELDFWVTETSKFNGESIWPRPPAVRVAYSDASRTGYAGYLVEHGDMIAHGQWFSKNAVKSST